MDPNAQQPGGPVFQPQDPIMVPQQPAFVPPQQNVTQPQNAISPSPQLQGMPMQSPPTGIPGMPNPQAGKVDGPVVGGPDGSKKPKFLLVIVIAVVVLGLMIGGVLLLAPKKKAATKKPAATTTTQAKGPQPATALDIEQSNNSINQDVTSLEDDKDFPADELSDKSIEL